MDGVLFNSMPYHAEAWHKVMLAHGLNLSREEAYLHEGRTGAGTINIVSQRQLGREATPEEIENIYHEKSEEFNKFPEPEPMPGAWELLQKIKNAGLTPMVVTGSGQRSLLDRLEHNFPGMFHRELMVTAFDVKHGKPNPEPYLMALEKGGFEANEAVVIEHAPLCAVMKEWPLHRYNRETGRKQIIATMACESARRQSAYLKTGCNAYHKRDPTSQPMSFWTEQDVLAYLKMTGIPYASVYGEIVEENGRLTTTGAKRTGCMFCMFGVHLEKEPNRFQRMALTHPKQYDFCIHKLSCGKVLDFLGVPYAPNGGETP